MTTDFVSENFIITNIKDEWKDYDLFCGNDCFSFIYFLMAGNEIKYIGITKHPIRRMGQHISNSKINKNYTNKGKNKWISESLKKSKKIKMFLFDRLIYSVALKKEKQIINDFILEKFDILNFVKNKNRKKTKTKKLSKWLKIMTLNIDIKLFEEIQKEAKKQTRSWHGQVVHILKAWAANVS